MVGVHVLEGSVGGGQSHCTKSTSLSQKMTLRWGCFLAGQVRSARYLFPNGRRRVTRKIRCGPPGWTLSTGSGRTSSAATRAAGLYEMGLRSWINRSHESVPKSSYNRLAKGFRSEVVSGGLATCTVLSSLRFVSGVTGTSEIK